MNMAPSRYSLKQRRLLVAMGVRAGKSNRAIAKELGVVERTVRNDRKYLAIPGHERPERQERTKKPKIPRPMYALDDPTSLVRHKGRVLKAVKNWIAEQRMVLDEIEHVVHEAGKQLVQGREFVKRIPIPIQKPEELLLAMRPEASKWGDFIPNPDYWAEWLARWLAICLPAQHKFHDEVLRESSLWARARAGGFVY